jgi:RNA polymerase sigma factor (sigma-70 family)
LQRLRRRVERARGRIIERAIPLAKRAAKKHRYAVVDLEQEAMIGLIRAVDTFDPAKGASFKTWVDRNVVYAIEDAIREQGHPVHISRSGNAEYLAYRRTLKELTQRYGAPPTDEEIAEEMGVPVERVRKVEVYVPVVVPFEEPDESGLTLEERIPAPEDPSEFSDELEALLDSLPGRTTYLLTSEARREERARALGLTLREVKTELQRERRRLREDPRVLAFKDAVGYETQEDRNRRLARLPQWPAQVPRPAKVRPVRRPPARPERYTLREPERLAVAARCDTKYRPVRDLPTMAFDIEEWRAGAEDRRRERIARAWADLAYLERKARVRRRLVYRKPVGWDEVVEQMRYIYKLEGRPWPFTTPIMGEGFRPLPTGERGVITGLTPAREITEHDRKCVRREWIQLRLPLRKPPRESRFLRGDPDAALERFKERNRRGIKSSKKVGQKCVKWGKVSDIVSGRVRPPRGSIFCYCNSKHDLTGGSGEHGRTQHKAHKVRAGALPRRPREKGESKQARIVGDRGGQDVADIHEHRQGSACPRHERVHAGKRGTREGVRSEVKETI